MALSKRRKTERKLSPPSTDASRHGNRSQESPSALEGALATLSALCHQLKATLLDLAVFILFVYGLWRLVTALVGTHP